MKKRLLAVVTAAVLALGCFATVNAKIEHSIKEELGDDIDTILIVDFDTLEGKSLNGKDYKLQAFLDGASADDDAVKVAYSHLRAQAKVTSGKIEKMFKIVCKDADEDDPAEIIIPYDKAKAGKGYTMWRYGKGNIWNNTDVAVTKVENGKIYCKVKNDGNVALVKGGSTTNASTDASKTNATAGTAGKTAPKTGEV
ncbi:MAG: hypothetical protein J5537_04705 [Lachnospiraceae bacterium]|nr:hypothetical protein [Lachnospiraceae bacterium]